MPSRVIDIGRRLPLIMCHRDPISYLLQQRFGDGGFEIKMEMEMGWGGEETEMEMQLGMEMADGDGDRMNSPCRTTKSKFLR